TGTLDTGFDPNANNTVFGVSLQADGKVLVGGNFTALQPNGAASSTTRVNFARLLNDAATQTLTNVGLTQVNWTRTGTIPEVSQVTFEMSTNNGVSWTTLGSGVRVGSTANWQLTGLSLPSSGQLRARGRTSGGYLNACSGIIESLA